MAILKCKMCGGDLNVTADETVVECEYCGSKQTIPTADNEKKMNLFARASRLLRNCEFDKAAGVFESIVAEFSEEAEAYWGLVLCKYGIEYVDDPATGNKVPTCHRSGFDSVMDDKDFELVMEYSDAIARRVYREQAKQIEELRKAIIEVSGREEPYDIFISYKETDDSGERTLDSVIAQDIYTELTGKGYRVFFSRITLEDKLGTEYEPYIFAALNSAKLMIVVGTDYDHFNAVWVKNEWSRFLALIAKGEKKVLIPAFKNIDAYDMPKEFAKLSAQDMGKVGAMQDLLRGVDKIIGKDNKPAAPVSAPAPVVQTIVQSTNGVTTHSLLRRAFMFLEDGEWEAADEYCEKVLDQEPENAEAYLGKLMVELKIRKRENLSNCLTELDSRRNYAKVLRFGDTELKAELEAANKHIRERIELERKTELVNKMTDIYNKAVIAMTSAKTEAAYKAAAEIFTQVKGFKDADEKQKACIEKAETCRKDAIYSAADKCAKDSVEGNKQAMKIFKTISGWRDADEQIKKREKLIAELEAKAERERIDAEKRAEEARIEAELSEKKAVLYAEIKRKEVELSQLGVFKGREKEQLQNEIAALKDRKTELDFSYIRYAHKDNTVCFGKYLQAKKGASEPIEWQVLTRTDNKVLLISKYAIDTMTFHGTNTKISWNQCSLRMWLNGDFYKKAFNAAEKERITINHTDDKIFLLSIDEARIYFETDKDRICKPTSYALTKGAYIDKATGNCWWWLRTSGMDEYKAANVICDGSINDKGFIACSDIGTVRPAMWINLDA